MYIVDHDLHIHSFLSTCSKCPEQIPERIARYAVEEKLSTVCITDHFWDETIPGASPWYEKQNFPHILQSKPLPQPEGVRFLFGCETELDQHLRVGISPERMEMMDFIIIPTTHFHMKFTLTEQQRESADRRADAWLKRLEAVLSKDLPFHKVGVAHLACQLIGRDREEYLQVMGKLPEKPMEELFQEAARLGVGIELNAADVKAAVTVTAPRDLPESESSLNGRSPCWVCPRKISSGWRLLPCCEYMLGLRFKHAAAGRCTAVTDTATSRLCWLRYRFF